MEINKTISTLIKSEKFKMKKKTFIAIILFCIFSCTYAQDKWIKIASTENKNLTETDIVRFFSTELGKVTYPYAAISYNTYDDGKSYFWECDIIYTKEGKSVRLVIRNAIITVDFFREPGWYVTTDNGSRIDSVNNGYIFSNMAYSTIRSCTIESKLLLKKHGQAYSGSELEGIEELKKFADLLKLNTLR